MAESVSGTWFLRSYEWNGYGKSWLKWKPYHGIPEFPTRVLNRSEYTDAPEYVDVYPGSVVYCGFSLLRPLREFNVRLPG
jgi:hypothetical protein